MDYLLFLPNYYSDYFYQNRSSTYYPSRGGYSVSGVDCGSFYVNAYSSFANTAWTRGSALSFKPDDDFVCPTFYSDYFYPARGNTYYAFRGGPSNSGAYCGAFYVAAYVAASPYSWSRGAALSFKPSLKL